MTVIVFEDEQVSQLFPITLGRPAFAISCGSYRLVDLLAELGQPLRAAVRSHLRPFVEADYTLREAQLSDLAEPALFVNARLVPGGAAVDVLQNMLATKRTGQVRVGESVAAAYVGAGAQTTLPLTVVDQLGTYLSGLGLPTLDGELPIFEFPHDVIRYHLATLADNLARRVSRGTYSETAGGVFCAAGAIVGPNVVTDTRGGPIVLESGASVGAHSLLRGPAYLGAGARVIEHAAIKDAVAIGHTTKIGGEVEASIVEPYTNKQHHGFLGHSYLGSWVNLGAGTCNSDLKNTYGQVNMEYGGRKVATGMQFIGAIVGDYAKTAINTGIFTGKTIGACSMVYGFVTTNVPSFVNYARLFGQVTEAPVDVLVSTQRRMFARRGVSQRPCDVQLLHDMHALTAAERKQAGEPLSLEPLSL